MTKSYNMGYVPDEKNVDDTDGVIVINKKDSPGATNGTSKLNGASNGYHNDGDAVRFQEVDLEDQPDGNKKPKDDVVKPKGATLAEMYSFATGLDKLLMLGGSLAALAHGAAWPLMMLVFGKMTDDFVYYNANTTDPNFNISSLNISFDDIAEQFEDNMTSYSLQYVYIGIGVGIGTYVQITFWQMACERQTYKLRLAFFKSLLRQNIGWYDKQQSGDLTTKLASDLEKVREGLGDKVALALQFMAQFVAGFALGFSKGWKMTLIMMSLTPLLAILAAVLGKLTVSYSTLETLNYAKAGAIAEEVLSCIRTVTSFNGQVQAIKKYHQALSKCMKFGVKKSMFAGLSVGLMLFIMFCAYGLAFWYGSTQVDDYNTSNHEDGLSPGSVLAIFFSVMVGSFALGSASPHISSFLSAKGAGGTVFPIIQNKPSIDSSDTGGKKPSTISGRIQLRNVSFTYPTRVEAQILQDFDLDIEPGQTVALVGSSGCGKSTIVNLIQRFYDPDQGTITLDGEDIRDLNIHWLRGNIGIVSQEPILFGMSIADNIKLGKPGIAMEEIEKAARMANAHDFISSLPNKYDTLVGERGAQLSGGQKQRVAIARALVRDPRILLLDEATSALDSESEGIVQAALDKAGVGRTTVIIAHRLSTIQNADVIYVLEEGKVVEKGKHHDLMTNQGAYYKLVTLQMITAEKEEEESKDAIRGASALRKRSINRQGSKQRSDSGPKAGLSTQLSTDSSTSRDVNLFRNAGKKPAEGEEEEEEENLELAGFGRIFKANLPEWPLIVFGCLAAMVNGAIFPAFSFIFSEIIKTFSKTGDELLDDGLLWSMLFVGLGGVAFVVNVIQNSAFGFSGERLTHRLRNEAFTNMVRQDIEYFDHPKHSTGALTTRLATDATIIKTATGIRLAMIVQSATSMIAGLTIAFVYGWKLAFAVLGGVPVIMAAGAINMRILKGNQLRDSSLLEEAGKVAGECVENIRTVQGLTREPYFYEYYAEKLMKPYKESLKQAHVYGISFAFSQSVFFFLYAAAYRFGAWLVVHDGMHPDLVFRVFFAITFTGMSVGQASSFLPEYAKAKLSASKIFKILDTIPKIDVYSTLGIKQVDQASANGKIEVKDVRFRYVTRPEVEVLKGVSIEVQPGQTAALVGISGCGKSTIMSLVQRFYDPESGSITVQGKDVKEYNLKSLRSLISVVSQEPILFDTTIRENIMYGLDTEMAMSDVIQAARTANAHNFISQLPDGYETTVGEKGTQLSGGQKQRVAIARALIRNPRILLLDEATSALDTESEKVVQEALDHARHGRTCIVIAHRLSTIQNADVIYVMEAGKVVESGTHQELLAKRGAYSVLVGGQRFKKEDDSKVDEADDEVN